MLKIFSPPTLPPMRIVGKLNRNEIELDPVRALKRGRILDAMLSSALPPVPHGVTRGTHEYFNRLDNERQVRIARGINAA
ncbi:MAG: hypothetical protein ACKVQK_11960 [Burkholderiales bacterium]